MLHLRALDQLLQAFLSEFGVVKATIVKHFFADERRTILGVYGRPEVG